MLMGHSICWHLLFFRLPVILHGYKFFLDYGANVFAKVTLTNCSSGALLLSTRARIRVPSQPFRTNAASVLAGRSLEICPSACASAMTFAIIADQVEKPLDTRARIISLWSDSSAPKLASRQPPQNSLFSAT